MKQLILSLLLLTSIGHSHEPAAPAPKGIGLKVLVYSNTGYYRHPETPRSIAGSSCSATKMASRWT
jgi:hypothetical protein